MKIDEGQIDFSAIRKIEAIIASPYVYADLFYHCSACGGKSSDNWADKFTFCPYCGAYMQDPEENDGE